MVRFRCQCNISQIFKKIVTFSSFIYLPINFKFLQDAISGFILHSYECYQLILITEFVPKMKYLCFDLMFFGKINQVILVAILLTRFEASVINDLLCDILLSLIPF